MQEEITEGTNTLHTSLQEIDELGFTIEAWDEIFTNSSNNVNEELLNDKSTEEDKIDANKFLEVVSIQTNNVATSYLTEKNVELEMKTKSLTIFTSIVIFQLLFINYTISKIGKGEWQFPEAVINIFITGVFVELLAIVHCMFKSLFPPDNNKTQADLLKSVLLRLDKKKEDNDSE